MKKQTKENIKRWGTIIVILFMVLMLVLAYMPGIFAPKNPRERVEDRREEKISTTTTGGN